MEYFDALTDRTGTLSLKWDIKDGELPLWVADMDFATAPEIQNALSDRLSNGIFGYTVVPPEWGASYSAWWKKRHNFALKPDALVFCTGVVPAISSMVRRLTLPAEKVVIQTPCYNIFFNSVVNNGRVVLEAPLSYDAVKHKYSVDFEALEKTLSDPQVRLFILCNPHNPTGIIWKKEELERVAFLCKKYSVTVISDEIHCDITKPQQSYVPFAAVSPEAAEISVTCLSPSKAFNIAGLQTAAVYAENATLRHRVWRGLNNDEVAEPSAFAITAAIAAFTRSENWLNALNEYLWQNRLFACNYIEENMPFLGIVRAEATYLLWLDCSLLLKDGKDSVWLKDYIREKTGLYVSAGSQYGGNGSSFLRINLATQRTRLEDALNRLKNAVVELAGVA